MSEDPIKRAVRKDVAQKQLSTKCPNSHDLEDVEASNVEWEQREDGMVVCGCGEELGYL